MSFYGDLSSVAQELIDEFGRAVTIRTYTSYGDNYDPTRVSDDYPNIKAVFADHSLGDIDGTRIKSGDKLLVIISPVALVTGMKILDGGIEYSVIPPLEEVKPGDTTVLYLANVRRS